MAMTSLRSCEVCRQLLRSSRRMQARLQQTLTSAYVFHPQIQTTEADKQMMLWTKTVPVETPPTVFTSLMDGVDMSAIKQIMETTILCSRFYEKRPKVEGLTRGTHKYFPASVIQNQFKNVVGFGRYYPQLRNLNSAAEVSVRASWKVQDQFISVHGKPGTFLNAKKPMPLFYEQGIVEHSREFPVTSLDPIDPFTDLNKYLVKDTTCTGIFPEKSFYPHFHTLLIVDNGEYMPPPSKGLPEIQLIQKGLLFTFARLLGQAIHQHGGDILGRVLPEPLCAQCIMTDGNRFSFLWYQLNTLDMSDLEGGVKNLVCVERPGEMFTTVVEGKWKKRHLGGFREDILKTYLTMLLLS